MKKLLPILFCCFLVATIFAQKNPDQKFYKIEDFILLQQQDSALFYIPTLKDTTDYKPLLLKLANNDKLSYKAYTRFLVQLSKRDGIDYHLVSNYINSVIAPPTNLKKIDLEYVDIKWAQVTNLRESTDLSAATKEQQKLDDYIAKFNQKDKEVIEAKLKASTHQIVMVLIQKDVAKGKKLCLDGLETAREIKNKPLQIIFLYHLSDFLLLEKDLLGYIRVCEEGLTLEQQLPKKTSYYPAILEHLLDAYIFKGGEDKRVQVLLEELYSMPGDRILSYVYYVKYLAKVPENSPAAIKILNKFEVKNISEFCEKILRLVKDKVNPNDYFRVLNVSSSTLSAHKYYDQALEYMKEGVQVTRKIYSEDLSKSIASYKTEQAVKQKNIEIKYEQQKAKLNSIIALLIGILLLVSVFLLFRFRKQSRLLTKKNRFISKTLKEKELLVKEVHHRVKNNFQIVSSLLEIQSKDIEDKKALELANDGKNRVKSMALIHQKLYQNKSGLVDFDEYIQLLVKELSVLNTTDQKITTTITSKDMYFDVDTAIPLGLIINEIITNSYKYAFSKEKENALNISIHKDKDDEYNLIIQDNGPGLDAALDIKKAKSLGLRLVTRLVKQLQGTLKQTNDNGAKFEIHFKDIHKRLLTE